MNTISTQRVFLVLKEDIVHYPPALSLITILTELHYKVIHVGIYSDEKQKKMFEERGVIFFSTLNYNGKANNIGKFYQQFVFRKQVKNYLSEQHLSENDFVWMMQAETAWLLSDLVGRYKTIVHLLEYVSPEINWKYRLIPSLSLKRAIHSAVKVVCCEYNRAQIAKGLFQLEMLPYILPNKPYLMEESRAIEDVPKGILRIIQKVSNCIKNKKVILYQGIFLDEERRLEEFCQAIKEMPDDYMLLAMGKGSGYYDMLKEKYESERILFVPFIRPPYHLMITKQATVGVLSYFPRTFSMASILNPLYCAPNKIFEYAKFGIPMISNDVPGLHYAYLEYKCGECIPYPMTPKNIQDTIFRVFDNYEAYSQGATRYYDSVDMKQIVQSILS